MSLRRCAAWLLAIALAAIAGDASAGYVSTGADCTSSSATSLTCAEPAGAAQDDLILGVCKRGNDTDDGDWVDPADWTQIDLQDETLGNPNTQYYLGRKVRGSGAGNALTFTFGGTASGMTCVITAWRDIDTSSPLDVTYSDGSHYNANNNAITTAAQPITTATDGAIVILLQGITQEVDSAAPPSGYTERAQVPDATVNNNRHLYVVSKVKTTAGVETPGAWGHVDSDADADGAQYTIALRPAATGGTVTITDVDTDEIVTATQANVVITGTGFGASQGGGSVSLRQGGTGKTLSVDSWSATSIQVDISGVGIGVVNGLLYGSMNIRVVNNSAALDDQPITVNPPSGTIYHDLSGGLVDLGFDGNGNASRLFGDPLDLQDTSQVGIRNASGCTASTDITINDDGSTAADEDCVEFDFDFSRDGLYIGTVGTVAWAGAPPLYGLDSFPDLVFQEDLPIVDLHLAPMFTEGDEAIDTYSLLVLGSTVDSTTDINGAVSASQQWIVDDASVLLDNVGDYVQCGSGTPTRLVWANPITNEIRVALPRSCSNNLPVYVRTTSGTSVAGLSVNSGTGVVSGTPTTSAVTGPIVFRATTASGLNADTP